MAEPANHGRSYVFTSLSSGFAIVATLASGIILARVLSVEDRGLVALVLYWMTFAVSIGGLSLNEALILRASQVGGPISKLLSSALAVAGITILVMSGILAAALQKNADRFGDLDPRWLIAFGLVFLLIRSLNFLLIAVEQNSLKFGRLALEHSILPLCYSGLLIIAGLTGNLTVAVVLIVFLISRAPVLLVRLWRFKGIMFLPVSMQEMKAVTRIGLRFHGAALVGSFSSQADKLVVAAQWGAVSIANFAVAYSAAGAAYSLVGQALAVITLPVTSKVPNEEMAEHFSRSIRITSILLAMFMVPIVVLAPILIPLVFGENYEGAVLYTQVLAISLLPLPIMQLVDTMLRSRDQVGLAMQLHLTTLLLFGFGWIVTGYPDIVSLGLGLAGSRFAAFVITILRVRNELETVRLSACVLWRREDFRLIFDTARGMIPSRTKGA